MNKDQQTDRDWVAFLQRPTFSLVLSVFFLVTGLLAWQQLPVREYPKVSVPIIYVETAYPAASARLVEREVTIPLESTLATTPALQTITSESYYSFSRIQLQFRLGTSLDQAMADVRERLGWARLPKQADKPAVALANTERYDSFVFLAVHNPNLTSVQLTHQARLRLDGALQSIPGVTRAFISGESYVMRILLDRAKMASFGVDASVVLQALRNHKATLPAGRLQKTASITVISHLHTPEEFAAICVKNCSDAVKSDAAGVVTLGDIADIKLSGHHAEHRQRVDGKPAIVVGVFVAEDANRVAVADAVLQALPRLQQNMSQGTHIQLLHDKAQPIRESLQGVQQAIAESVLLVVLVLFAFLRRLRITLIPIVVIPVSLLTSLALLRMCGFSLNIISLLGIALAVGIVVDDAIVVVENIYRHVVHAGLSAKQAALKSGRELGFAIVGITLTLVSVYAPIAWMPDLMGQVFQQFAVALAGSVAISGVLALTLSPMMLVSLLPKQQHRSSEIKHNLQFLQRGYERIIKRILSQKAWAILATCILVVLTATALRYLPREMLPHEDLGGLGVWVRKIPNMPVDEFDKKYVRHIENIVAAIPEGRHVFGGAHEHGAWLRLFLKPHHQRQRSDEEIKEVLQKQLSRLPNIDANVWLFESKGLPGIHGSERGADISLILKTDDSYETLAQYTHAFTDGLQKQQAIQSAWRNINLKQKAFDVRVDWDKAARLGIDQNQIADALRIFFHRDVSCKWYKDNISYNALIELAQPSHYLEEVEVATKSGQMLPLSEVATFEETILPQGGLQRRDQMRAAQVGISVAKGHSVQEAMRLVQGRLNDTLPQGFVVEWDDSIKQQRQAFHTMGLLLILAVLFIYGTLVVLFNSFLDPLVILLTVPLACGGALALMWLLGMPLSVFSYLGLITLVGLITKHGILLVEFGGQLLQQGLDPLQAAQQAAQQRFRPILMTALSTVIGHAPLLWAMGAGGAARRAIGVVLVGGMVTGTLLTLFIIPILWAWVRCAVRR